MKVIVTGAAGFIGYHVAERCLAAGYEVLGIDNLDPYYDVALKRARLQRLREHRSFVFAPVDLTDAPAFGAAFAAFGPDVVVHLAAQAGVRHSLQAPQAYVNSNVTGFLTVLEACRHHPVSHLIYASSSSVYGLNDKVPFSEGDRADHPVSLYAATKRANELMAHSYAHLFAIPATGLRFFTVYGPWGRPDMMPFLFTRAIARGEPIPVFNGGRMERDFTYIDDAVDGIMPLLGLPPGAGQDGQGVGQGADGARTAAPHRLLNIGNNRPVPLSRFIRAIETALGRSALQDLQPMQPGDVPRTCADVESLAALTGFVPRTDVETGVARFVAWYRAHHGDERADPLPLRALGQR